MNEYQRQLVQNSFRHVVPIADQAAALFYNHLFTLDPSLRPLFKGDMTQQGLKLTNTLQLAVNGLDNLEQIIPALHSLGRKHVDYGVQDAHYATVGEALMLTLAEGLGAVFTDEVRGAWQEVYGLLSGVMIEAANTTA
ncbi:MAG: globin family protein [Chloroflexota bacterium]